MVKIKGKIFFTFLIIFCLVGCTSKYEFIEKEGYNFKYDERVALIRDSIESVGKIMKVVIIILFVTVIMI